MLDVYTKQVRSILELAVPVWSPGLTQLEVKQLERVQKTAFHIIVGEDYVSYDNALDILGCDRLLNRRKKLCENFGKRAMKHPKFKSWFRDFIPKNPKMTTRGSDKKHDPKFIPVPSRTNRFKKSPLPYLTELLNMT